MKKRNARKIALLFAKGFFPSYRIKIVLTSTDPAIIPKVRDLRIIALPAE